MGIPFKKIVRKDPRNVNDKGKYYPQLVTLGNCATLDSIAYMMKERSSLTLGDIQSVLTNFIESARTALYNGQSVNIPGFGVFSLSARTKGTEKEEDCTAKNILGVKINFRASSNVRPNLTSTRAGEKLEFIDIKAALARKEPGKEDGGDDGDEGGGGGGIIDPTA